MPAKRTSTTQGRASSPSEPSPRKIDRAALEGKLIDAGFKQPIISDCRRKHGVDILLGHIPADPQKHQERFDAATAVLNAEGLIHQLPRLFPGNSLVIVINDVHYPTQEATA